MIAPLENTLNVRSSLLIKCLNCHKCLGSLLVYVNNLNGIVAVRHRIRVLILGWQGPNIDQAL